MPLLQTTTAEGAAKGMILARAPHELGEQEAAYLQDCLVNQPGFVVRRGAITGTQAITSSDLDTTRPVAACPIVDPAGVQKVGVFYLKDTGSLFELWCAVYTVSAGTFSFVQKHYIRALTSANRKVWVQAVPAIDGSVIISVRKTTGRATGVESRQFRWFGACPTVSMVAAGQVVNNLTFTEGSTGVTGAAGDIANVSFPGLVLAGLGVVASITSTTRIELVYPAPATTAPVSLNYFFAERLSIARARGKVTCTAGVLVGLTGYGTKFTEAGLGTVTGVGQAGYSILDPTTMQLLAENVTGGLVHPSDTLTAVPSTVARSASMKNYLMYHQPFIACVAPRYARPGAGSSGDYVTNTPQTARGSFWATYKGLMVSFNAAVGNIGAVGTIFPGDLATTSRCYIHGPRFPEIMDHSVADGDWFEVQSTVQGDPDGIAVQGGSNSVILCKSQETFALTGDLDDFSLDKIADDGALSFESTASWQGMPIWLGRSGIWMFNGQTVDNITSDTLGPRWKELVKSFDQSSSATDSDTYLTNQARCFVYKDYLFVNITNTNSQHVVYTDGVARTSNTMQLMIYLPTMACSFLTNFNWQCFFQIANVGYVILPQLGSTTHHLFPIDYLISPGSFGAVVSDSILTANSYNSGTLSTSVGPWFHMESRGFDVGDGLLKKNWKQLAIEFKESNTKRMFLDTVAGLNVTAVRAALPFTGTGSFLAARVKFRTRDQYMRFRLYEDINNRPDTLTLGAWQWAFKSARRGAV